MFTTAETGKVYRAVMGRPKEGEDKVYSNFLIRFLGVNVFKGQAVAYVEFLDLKGDSQQRTSINFDRFGAGEGKIFELEPIPNSPAPTLSNMEKELLKNCEQKGCLAIECSFCSEVEEVEIGDEMPPEDAAVCLHDQGWRSASSGHFASVGIACPYCMRGESEDGPTDLKEEI